MKIYSKVNLLLVFLIISIPSFFGQNNPITNGSVSTCTGTFSDAGGYGMGGGGQYGNNQDFTFTICPDVPGLIQLNFTAFDLEANYDWLQVFDGNSTGAPSLGVYDNNVPLLGIVAATSGNATGCLTFVFHSDISGTYGGWQAAISCTNPCQTVQADLTSTTPNANNAPNNGIINLCQGDNASFSGSGLYPQNNTYYAQSNATSTFNWTFGDGSSAVGQNVNHAYANEGAYMVQLSVEDVNGCTNTNRIDQLVYVSTTPIFDGTSVNTDPICLGELDTLVGVVTPVTYNQTCTPGLFAPLALPDGTGVTYSTSVTLDCYGPGQTINSATDILGICMNMEHSYMGDLEISIECPSGQSINLVTYPNGGGGTYLGVPVDNDLTPNSQGTGWDYCFTPTATNGTWAAESGSYTTLPAGDYTPVDAFAGLVGCDLNGDWTISITDNLGSDNGFIFSWSVDINPLITPPPVTFTPNVVTEGWQADPTIVGTFGNSIIVQPTATGNNCYTYEMTDDFGCTYDTTVCFTVNPGLTVNNLNLTLCENPSGSGTATNIDLTANNPSMNFGGYSFTWYHDGALTNPVSGPNSETVSDGQVFYVEATDGNCTVVDTVTYTVTSSIIPIFDAIANVCQNATAPTLLTTSTNGITGTWSPAVSTATAGTTTYTFTPNAGQCATTTTLDITVNPQITPTFTPIASVCQNAAAPALSTTSNNGITGTWSPAVSTATAGTTTYTFTPSAGLCATTTTLDITVNPNPVPTATADSVNCNGGTDGSVTVTGIVGTSAFPGGYGYSWDDDATPPAIASTQTANGLGIGTYTVTVTDLTTTCTGQTTATIFEPPLLTATNTPTNPTCAQGTNGSITANPSGGTGAYTYSWAPSGQTTQTATGLSSGINYTCTITDHNGCPTTTSATLTDPAGMVLNTSMNQANCGASDGDATVTVTSGGSGTFTYSWNTTPVQNTATASGIPAGTYIATVNDVTFGCTSTDTIIVTTTTGITATATFVSDALCNGSSDGVAYAFPTGGNPGYTYLWDDISGSTNDTLFAAAGTYNVTITDTNGCTGTDVVTIGEPTVVIASVTASTDETCLGANNGTATAGGVQGTGGYTYSWNTTPVQTTQTATGLAPGIYVVTVFDANMCSDTASVVINQGPSLSVSHTSTDVSCFNGTNGAIDVTVSGASGPITYAWTPSGGASEDPVGLTAGTYYLTATSLGCTINDTVQIFEPTQLVAAIDASFDALCAGETNGSAYGSASGGVSPYTYFWGAASGGQTTATATGLGAGNYTLIVTDSNNCNATVPVVINEPVALNAVLGSFDAYCGLDQGTVWADPTNGTAPYTYAWDSAGTLVGTLDTINGLFPGDYALNITDANNCKFNGTVTVNAAPGGVASIASQTDVSCFGGADGTATVSSTGFPGFTYLWDAAAGNQTSNPAIGLAQGSYNVTVTDTLGCQMPTSVIITEPTQLTVGLVGNNPLCPDSCNASITASPSGGTSPYSYVWDDGQFTPTALGLCSNTYTVTITDAKNCTVSDSLAIVNPPMMTIDKGTTPASCGQSDGSAWVSVLTNGTAPFTYQWENGTGVVGTSDTLSAISAGTYSITVFDANSCSVTDTVTIIDLNGPVLSVDSIYHVQCFGGNDGYAEVSVGGGLFPYTYTWTTLPVQSTPAATNLSVGTYTITIEDDNGCVVSTSIDIEEPTKLALSSDWIDPTCTGYSDGSAWVIAQGGTAPYSYEWNSNSTLINDTIYNLPAIGGGYTVTVTDSNNCFETANVVLTDPLLFTINPSKIDVSCFGYNNGEASVTTNNGISPFTYLWNDPSAQTTATASGLSANTYNVIATDSNGCVANGSVIINEPTELIITEDTVVNVTCNGLSDGFAQVNVTGGSGTYSFEWTLGATVVSTVQNPTGLAAGFYAVVVTDTAGCTDQININVTEPTALSGSVTGFDAKCHGANSGMAYATINGGTQPYAYAWDDLGLQQTDTAFNLIAGNYLLDVTDSNGCQLLDIPVFIDQPDSIVLTPATISSTCGFANGTASVTVGGGISPYNFIWNDPATQGNAVATALSAGGYQVIVTDAQGCQDSAIANVTDLGSPTVVMDSIKNVTCNGAGDGMAYASAYGGVAPYTYLWTNGDTTLNATNLNAQSYTITVTDSNGCTASADTVIQENAGVVVVANLVQNVSCNGGSDGIVYANGNGGTGSTTLTYSWNDPLTQANDTAFNLTIGTYIVEATDLNNCKAFDTVEVIEPLLLTTTLDSLNDLTCYQSNDGYIDVSAAGGTLPYTWSSNAVGGPTLSGLAAGGYYLIVTDAKGCTDSTNYTVTEPNELVISEITTASTCGNFNGSSEVTSVTGGTGPYAYSWNDPLNQQTALADSLLANTYTVIVTDFNGCTKDTTVVVLNTPGSTIDSVVVVDVDCNGNSTGSAEAFVSGTAPFSYTWAPSGHLTAQANSLTAGVYSVEVVDSNGCITTRPGIIVNEPSPLTAVINVQSYACFGEVVQLMGAGSGGTQPYNDILWVEPFGNTTLGPVFDTVTSNTTYILTIKDTNDCAAIINKSIIVGTPLNISALDGSICLGDTASVLAVASGGNPANTYEYTWSVYDSTTSTINTPAGIVNPTSGASVNLYTTDTTDYIVSVWDGCSRPDTAGFTIVVKDTTIITMEAYDKACPTPDYFSVGMEVEVLSGDTINTYTWLFGDGQGLTSMSDSISHNYSSGTYDVQIDVMSENGCPSTFIYPAKVYVYPVPDADFTKDPFEVTMLNPTFEFSDLSSPTVDIAGWDWSFGDLIGSSIEQNPSYTYQDTGIYPVTLIVTNGLCEDTITKKVKVKPEFLFIIPNSFTPQGDGLNEVFMPGTMIGVAENDYNFFIYDRWGEVIYEGHDLDDGWDGYYKGAVSQTGVYVYYVKLKGIDGLQREFRGHVNLLR